MSVTTTTKQKTRGTSAVTELGYQRPSDWVSVPAMGTSEIVYLVVAVDDVSDNFVNLQFGFSINNQTVDIDWGDGTTSTGIGNAGETHNYDYSTLSATVTSEGFKTALITVTPSAGNTGSITIFDISRHHETGENFASSNYLEMYVNLPDVYRMYAPTTSAKHRRMRYINIKSYNVDELHICSYMSSLEQIDLPWQPTSNSIGLTTQAFAFCHNLKRAPYFDTSSVTDMEQMFIGCHNLQHVPNYNTSSATTVELMFSGCHTLREIPELDFTSVTNMLQFAEDAKSLETVKIKNTGSVTNMANAFKNSGLREFPNLDVSSVTNFASTWFGTQIRELPELNFPTHQADYASAFSYCKALEKLPDSLANINPTNTYAMFEHAHNVRHVPSFTLTNAASCGRMFYNTYGLIILDDFDFSGKSASQMGNMFTQSTALKRIKATGFEDNITIYGELSGEAIDEVLTNLPTVTGKTINFLDHYGWNDATPSIGTAKGWTVTGSDVGADA